MTPRKAHLKQQEGGGATSTTDTTFSCTTPTLSTSLPQAMSSTTERKEAEKKEGLVFVDDNTTFETLMQPGNLTIAFKPSGGASGSMQAAASDPEERIEEREGKKQDRGCKESMDQQAAV